MIPAFDVIGTVTVAELCLGFALLHSAIVPAVTQGISGWFEAPVDAVDIDRTIAGTHYDRRKN